MPETSSSRRILSADSHLEVSPDRWRPYVDKEFQAALVSKQSEGEVLVNHEVDRRFPGGRR